MDNEYVLKHKNIPVLLFTLNDDYELSDVISIFDKDRIPFGIKYLDKKEALYKQLSDWIENRGLPRSRSDLVNIQQDMNVKSAVELSFGSYALNLTDQYWVHKSNVNLNWEDVNFFNNNFKEIINFDISGIYEDTKNIVVAPDLTVDGSLKKKWIINNETKKRYLIKGSRYDEMQEPFNEYIASNIIDLLNIKRVEYGLIRNESNNMPLSICECMVDENKEFITAQMVLDMELKNGRNEYDRFIQICKKYGITSAEENINEMIIIDYLIGNTDRHTGNFGIIRNPNTLEWLNVVPIFDNGNSFCHNVKEINGIEKNIDSLCRWMGGGNFEKLSLIKSININISENKNNIIEMFNTGINKNENISIDKINILNDILLYRINSIERQDNINYV